MPTFSLKTVVIGVMAMLGALSLSMVLITAVYFKEAALTAKRGSVAQVLDLAIAELVRQLHQNMGKLGNTLVNSEQLKAAAKNINGPAGVLAEYLDEPFLKGYVHAEEVELVKLRLYDNNLNLVAESGLGKQGLPPRLSTELAQKAQGREGADRLKAIGGLWVHANDSLYSVLLPLGGLQALGYVELVAAPGYNLNKLAAISGLTVQVRSSEGALVSGPASVDEHPQALVVARDVRTHDGVLAYRVYGYQGAGQLYEDMRKASVTAIAAFSIVSILSILAGTWLLNRILFQPLQLWREQFNQCASGNLDVRLAPGVLTEFNYLAQSFNVMAKKLEANWRELYNLSRLDGLTGLYNRRHLDLTMTKEWQRAHRSGESLSLIFLDIDFFKQFNDTYGHLDGDECLRRVGGALGQSAKRAADLVARYGGEEFAILLPGTPQSGVKRVAEEVHELLAGLDIKHGASPFGRVTVSIGAVTVRASELKNQDELAKLADEALYRAKNSGRNRSAFVDRTNLI